MSRCTAGQHFPSHVCNRCASHSPRCPCLYLSRECQQSKGHARCRACVAELPEHHLGGPGYAAQGCLRATCGQTPRRWPRVRTAASRSAAAPARSRRVPPAAGRGRFLSCPPAAAASRTSPLRRRTWAPEVHLGLGFRVLSSHPCPWLQGGPGHSTLLIVEGGCA